MRQVKAKAKVTPAERLAALWASIAAKAPYATDVCVHGFPYGELDAEGCKAPVKA